jgi:lipid II:glycine glycyltransferase (peptidoglycan interpeptide bridge formation enzyme)
MRSIKRSYNYDLVIEESNSVDDFYNLVQKVSLKDGFKAYTKNYYEDIFKTFKKDNYIKNFIAKINIDKVIAKFEEQVKNEKNEDRINKLNKDINFLRENRTSDKDVVIASLICIYTENGAWSLYIGNDNIAEYTGTVNRLYYEFMKDAYLSNKEFSDLFGTVGDPHTKYKNLAGIYEYKRKLGGTYTEWLGDFDLVNKRFWYKVLPILLKIYRTIKR